MRLLRPKGYVRPRAGRLGERKWLPAGTVGKVGMVLRGKETGRVTVDFPGGPFGTWCVTMRVEDVEPVTPSGSSKGSTEGADVEKATRRRKPAPPAGHRGDQ